MDRTETFAFNVPVDALPGSLLTIEATATDTSGSTQTSAPLLLRVTDAIAPTVEITGVSSGQRVQPGQTVTAVVSRPATQAASPRSVSATSGATVRNEQRQVAPAQTSVATSFQFTVPANAASTDRVVLSAFALDASSNRGDAAQVTLPLADSVAPTVTLRTAQRQPRHGTRRDSVQVIVEGGDDVACAAVDARLGRGRSVYADSSSFSTTTTTASASFALSVPANVAPGATITLTGARLTPRATLSPPATVLLTARLITDVTMPNSLLLSAGESSDDRGHVGQAGLGRRPEGRLRQHRARRRHHHADRCSSPQERLRERPRSRRWRAGARSSSRRSTASPGRRARSPSSVAWSPAPS